APAAHRIPNRPRRDAAGPDPRRRPPGGSRVQLAPRRRTNGQDARRTARRAHQGPEHPRGDLDTGKLQRGTDPRADHHRQRPHGVERRAAEMAAAERTAVARTGACSRPESDASVARLARFLSALHAVTGHFLAPAEPGSGCARHTYLHTVSTYI